MNIIASIGAGTPIVGSDVGKYDPPPEHLVRAPQDAISLTLNDLDELVPGGLPPSARRFNAWWSNETSGRHVQARARLDAGWVVSEVNLTKRTVTFERAYR